jgi:hypothetical protein
MPELMGMEQRKKVAGAVTQVSSAGRSMRAWVMEENAAVEGTEEEIWEE